MGTMVPSSRMDKLVQEKLTVCLEIFTIEISRDSSQGRCNNNTKKILEHFEFICVALFAESISSGQLIHAIST